MNYDSYHGGFSDPCRDIDPTLIPRNPSERCTDCLLIGETARAVAWQAGTPRCADHLAATVSTEPLVVRTTMEKVHRTLAREARTLSRSGRETA